MTLGDKALLGLSILLGVPLVAFCVWLWCRPFGAIAEAFGLWDAPGGRKDHEQPVRIAGGLALLAACLAGAALLVLRGGAPDGLLPVLAGGVLAAAFGLLDDARKRRGGGLPALVKLAGQLGSGALALLGGVELRLLGDPLGNGIATVLWVAAASNAWNFLDNMDGLAAGTGAAAALSFAAMFFLLGELALALYAAGLAGFCLGFLPHNFPRARIFLGDGGSQLLGYLFAVLAFEGSYVAAGGPGLLAALVPVAVLAVPLFDMAQVILSRLLAGEPIYRGDRRHLSFLLARRLGSRKAAALSVWALAALLGGISVAVPLVSFPIACALFGVQAVLFAAAFFFARGGPG